MVNSKQKGKAGERDAAATLRSLGFTGARRGQQFKGTAESPDIADAIPGCHIEVKRTEKFQPWAAMKQAEEESDNLIPVVMFRRNRSDWHVMVPARYLGMFAHDVLKALGYHIERSKAP